MVTISPVVLDGIPVLAVAVSALFALGYTEIGVTKGEPSSSTWRRFAAGSAFALGWMLLVAFPASAGWLLRGDLFPPPLMLLMAFSFLLAILLGVSALGKRFATGIPLAALVGAQAFRLPLEYVLHTAYRDGIMPRQMSFSGYNFDIVSGISAVIVAILLVKNRISRPWVWAWNILGILLLLTIITIAIASTPVFHAFGTRPEQLNTWIASFPFIWLPCVLVPAAIFGHILITRRLLADAQATAESISNSAS